MGSLGTPQLSAELLRSYSEAALRNAGELASEAALLRDHGHYARAYFLSVASIEEVGKALLAFDSQQRNLSDPGVCSKLKTHMESHRQKITYALMVWAFSSSSQNETWKSSLDLVSQLRHGREPSMYSELRAEPDRVQIPSEVVRPQAARDCVRLAEHTLAYAQRHVREKVPAMFSSTHDRLLTMKSKKLHEMLNLPDFWWFYVSRMEAGQVDIATAVLDYERNYQSSGARFSPDV